MEPWQEETWRIQPAVHILVPFLPRTWLREGTLKINFHWEPEDVLEYWRPLKNLNDQGQQYQVERKQD